MEFNSVELPSGYGGDPRYVTYRNRQCRKCGRNSDPIWSSGGACDMCRNPDLDRPGAISVPTRPNLRERIIFDSQGKIVRREAPDARGYMVGVEINSSAIML